MRVISYSLVTILCLSTIATGCGAPPISSTLHGSRNGNGGFAVNCKEAKPYFPKNDLYSVDYAIAAKDRMGSPELHKRLKPLFKFEQGKPETAEPLKLDNFLSITNPWLGESLREFTNEDAIRDWIKVQDFKMVMEKFEDPLPEHQHDLTKLPSNCDQESIRMIALRYSPSSRMPGIDMLLYYYSDEMFKLDGLQQSFLLGHEWLWNHNNTDNVDKVQQVVGTNIRLNYCLHETKLNSFDFASCFFDEEVPIYSAEIRQQLSAVPLIFSPTEQIYTFKNVSGGKYMFSFPFTVPLKAPRVKVVVDGVDVTPAFNFTNPTKAGYRAIPFHAMKGDEIEIALRVTDGSFHVGMLSGALPAPTWHPKAKTGDPDNSVLKD